MNNDDFEKEKDLLVIVPTLSNRFMYIGTLMLILCLDKNSNCIFMISLHYFTPFCHFEKLVEIMNRVNEKLISK